MQGEQAAEPKEPSLDPRDRLIQIVETQGLLRDLPEPIQLASGEFSRDFIDGKRALADGVDLKLACQVITEELAERSIDFDVVGGLTMGADQFSHALAVLAGRRWIVVRKQTKGRGTNKRIEGADVREGTRVLLVDDVVTTGGSIREAYEVIRETGAEIVAAVTLVDRGDVASQFFSQLQVPYIPLVTYRDLGIQPVGRGRISA